MSKAPRRTLVGYRRGPTEPPTAHGRKTHQMNVGQGATTATVAHGAHNAPRAAASVAPSTVASRPP